MSHQERTSSCVSPRIVLFEKKRKAQVSRLGGHTNTERGYLPVLASKLHTELAKLGGEEKIFETTSIHISQEDRHPLDFV